MKAPQIIYIAIVVVSYLAQIYDYGKKDKPIGIFTSTVINGLMVGLLIWGGFFR